MRKLLQMVVVLALVGLADSAYGQSSELLEEKYGFKIFKFGTRIEDHLLYLRKSIDPLNNPFVEYYTYTGDCCHTLFGVEADEISLAYYKDVLYQVSANFFSFSEEEHRVVLGSLEYLLGEPQAVDTFENPGLEDIESHAWISDRVKLELVRFRFMEERRGFMVLYENQILTRILADDF